MFISGFSAGFCWARGLLCGSSARGGFRKTTTNSAAECGSRGNCGRTYFSPCLPGFSLTAGGFVIRGLLQDFSWRLALSSLVYVALLLAMPFVVWRYLRAPYEFVVGVFLFTLSAILLSGTSLPPAHGRAAIVYLLAACAQVVALVMVPVGFVEHLEFLKLRRKIHALKEAA
jgi:hypothetical protein